MDFAFYWQSLLSYERDKVCSYDCNDGYLLQHAIPTVMAMSLQ